MIVVDFDLKRIFGFYKLSWCSNCLMKFDERNQYISVFMFLSWVSDNDLWPNSFEK